MSQKSSSGPGNYEDAPEFQGVRAMFQPEGYSIYQHSDDPVPGRTPPNGVRFVLWLRFEGEKIGVAVRFKNRAAVLELAAELVSNASEVTWPSTQE